MDRFAARVATPFGPVLAFAVLVSALALGACATAPAAPAPEVHHVMSRPEMQGRMRGLARELAELGELTHPAAPSEPARAEEVIATLDRIERQARLVGGEGVVTNYSLVNDYMGAFLYDVTLAREFARRDPPNLVPASALVRSCLACHGSL